MTQKSTLKMALSREQHLAVLAATWQRQKVFAGSAR
jgi:hypothetical protein